jgi:trimethylamine:corrinoid methyltransferase-like protein
VFDDEIVAHAKRFIRPVEVREDLPARELIAELVRERHLLTAEHTLAHWPEELYLPGPMVDRTNWDQWAEQGSRHWRRRALDMIDETLGRYEEPPLDAALHRDIQDLFRRTCNEPGVVLPTV